MLKKSESAAELSNILGKCNSQSVSVNISSHTARAGRTNTSDIELSYVVVGFHFEHRHSVQFDFSLT